VQHRVDFGSTFGAISAIPTTVSSSVTGHVIFQQRNALDRRLLRCQETSVETTATMTDFFMASPSLPE
jgi:hypothetical protein